MTLSPSEQWLASLAETAPLAYAYDEPLRQGAVRNLNRALRQKDAIAISNAFTGLSNLFDAVTCNDLQDAYSALTGKRGAIRSAGIRRMSRKDSLKEGLRMMGL